MKQIEKSQQSKEKILHAAVSEFGAKGYAGASLNALLSDNGLSKGLLYHYFENKDQLYLGCVSVCFHSLMAWMSRVERGGSAAEVLRSYFDIRRRFFVENPMLERMFFEAILQPPVHLERELTKARADFDAFNRTLFQLVLRGLKLREGVSEEDGLYYFNLMQSALHLQFRSGIDCYEERAYQTMELLLYGLDGGERL